MHVLVTGGSGFIGGALCRELRGSGHRVTVLTRNRAHAAARLPAEVAVVESLAAVAAGDAPDGVVNLAGENLGAHRWNAARKRAFVDSRVGTTRKLVDC